MGIENYKTGKGNFIERMCCVAASNDLHALILSASLFSINITIDPS